MGWLMGLEPTTPGITIQYSTFELQPPSKTLFGTPGGNRTHNPRLRRPVLYPLSYGRNSDSLPRPATSRKTGVENRPESCVGRRVIYSSNSLIVNEKSARSP